MQCVRFQNKLHWLLSSVLLLDVGNLKILELVALASLHCRISSSLYLHAIMTQNRLTVLALELPVIHAMKLPTKRKPGDQVCQVEYLHALL
jgi:hypothetical protein